MEFVNLCIYVHARVHVRDMRQMFEFQSLISSPTTWFNLDQITSLISFPWLLECLSRSRERIPVLDQGTCRCALGSPACLKESQCCCFAVRSRPPRHQPRLESQTIGDRVRHSCLREESHHRALPNTLPDATSWRPFNFANRSNAHEADEEPPYGRSCVAMR